MFMIFVRRCILAALLLAFAPAARAAQVPTGFVDELITTGLSQPTNFDFIGPNRILVVEKTSAKIRLVDHGAMSPIDPVGIVPDVRTGALDQGLLGIAVDPRWPAKPYIYVFYTAASGPNLHLTRYALTGDLTGALGTGLVLDVGSRREILADLPDDSPFHNGGTILFGRDSTLYVGLGFDTLPCAPQDMHEMRGKILRIDVRNVADGPGPTPYYQELLPQGNPFASDEDPRTRLIWHYGLRNPWSFDVDDRNGTMAIADVGENDFEEIDVVSASGRNFGYPVYEGTYFVSLHCGLTNAPLLTMPVYAYAHADSSRLYAVIMGGICKREWSITTGFPDEYVGNVFFADLYEGKLRRLVCSNGSCSIAPPVPGQPEPGAWATGLAFANRMRFGPDGFFYYAAAGQLRRIRSLAPVGVPPAMNAQTGVRGAWPVPSAGAVSFRYALAAPMRSSFAIVDVRGRTVRRLEELGLRAAGEHVIAWDGRDAAGNFAPAGVYFGVLEANGERSSGRIVRTR